VIVVRGDPLDDIRTTNDVVFVMRAGEVIR
jgi:hypothetical protein